MRGRNPFLFCMISIILPSAASGAEAIRLEDHSENCGGCYNEVSTFVRKGRQYRSRMRLLGVEKVSSLRKAALCSGHHKSISLAILGITDQQIKSHESEALKVASWANPSKPLPQHLSHSDVERALQDAVERYSHPYSLNKGTIKVTFVGNPGLSISSANSVPSMGPWSIQMGNKSWQTYSPEVARGVLKLLSKDSHNLIASETNDYWSQAFWKDQMVWGDVLVRYR